MIADLNIQARSTSVEEPTLLLIGGNSAGRQMVQRRLDSVGVGCRVVPHIQNLQVNGEDFDPLQSFQEVAQRISQLTKKEVIVLESVLDGQTNKTISMRLDLTERAVELRKASLMKKLGVRCHTELIRLISQFQTIQQYLYRQSVESLTAPTNHGAATSMPPQPR